MSTKEPNPAHLAIAECEARLSQQGRSVVVVTQNIDELHRRAGSKNMLEIHGESSPSKKKKNPHTDNLIIEITCLPVLSSR